MLDKKRICIDKLNTYFSIYRYDIEGKSKIGFTDENIVSEDFILNLLNIIWGTNLRNLNNDEDNASGIDLGDEQRSWCVQVTSDRSIEKVKDTLEKCKKIIVTRNTMN